ncbi:MAG: arginine--tRNA ligase [Lewinellaceae bacterium]|nr:arginine--tRNA ligase [Saprospiraceae bacterium]MCB9330300.1 arginine--tRNA ligase [Lewinellaceae bacterium]
MAIIETLQKAVAAALQHYYGVEMPAEQVQVNTTSAEFTGDYTVVVFPFVKLAKKAPDVVGAEIGAFLKEKVDTVQDFNVIKGFLNLELSTEYWQSFLSELLTNPDFGKQPDNGHRVMVEYSSPNTNKPLHLGHIRNCLLGWSCSKLLEATGNQVVRAQVINDRGVAICKSMLAWQKFGEGATPESSGIKGDHLVGEYYVLFENKSKEEYAAWQKTDAARAVYQAKAKPDQPEDAFFKDFKNNWFNQYSALGTEVREMLLRWEAGDPDTVALWKKLNSWVYAGFDETYAKLGVAFDKLYYESDTYLLGKDIVEDGLKKKVFFRKDDGSVWVDLTDAGMDQKVVLRADGTSVYITQDLGTARKRYDELGCDRVVYVVADEQNYHFTVLFEVLKRLGEPYADGLHHLSYGLVELPTGRMKTREGTVVDADDLIEEVIRVAREQASEHGALDTLSPEEQEDTLRKIALGALKFFIIKVNPKKRMIFNPEESVDLQGQTGPYIQYSGVRINGLMQRVEKEKVDLAPAGSYTNFEDAEKELLKALHAYPDTVKTAAAEYDPSHLANYSYNLAKSYHRFWHDVSVFNADDPAAKAFRLQLSKAVGQVLASGMDLLGIEIPQRM